MSYGVSNLMGVAAQFVSLGIFFAGLGVLVWASNKNKHDKK